MYKPVSSTCCITLHVCAISFRFSFRNIKTYTLYSLLVHHSAAQVLCDLQMPMSLQPCSKLKQYNKSEAVRHMSIHKSSAASDAL